MCQAVFPWEPCPLRKQLSGAPWCRPAGAPPGRLGPACVCASLSCSRAIDLPEGERAELWAAPGSTSPWTTGGLRPGVGFRNVLPGPQWSHSVGPGGPCPSKGHAAPVCSFWRNVWPRAPAGAQERHQHLPVISLSLQVCGHDPFREEETEAGRQRGLHPAWPALSPEAPLEECRAVPPLRVGANPSPVSLGQVALEWPINLGPMVSGRGEAASPHLSHLLSPNGLTLPLHL